MKIPKTVRNLIAYLECKERVAALTARLRAEQDKTDRLYAQWLESRRRG